MVVKIRFKRIGRTNRTCFRLSAIESRNPRDGRVLENLGLYDPLAPRVNEQLKLKGDRIQHWVSKGAQISVTAATLCARLGIALPAPKARAARKRKRAPAKLKEQEARYHRIFKAKKERRQARLVAKKAAAKSEAKAES